MFYIYNIMKIILSEKQYFLLSEQLVHLSPINSLPLIAKLKDDKDNWDYFTNVVRPEIEKRGQKLFPANEMVVKNPKFKLTPEYRELKDKEDAYDHQLASAMVASMFGSIIGSMIGQANEIKGALRIFFKGAPSKGVGRFEKFSSGWDEDNANNSIGISLAQKYPKKTLDFYSQEVLKNIQSKNYFDSTGKKKS